MNTLVTAFGPFAGRAENASSLALGELKRQFPAIRFRILPVDAVVAPARLLQALRVIRPDALVMLGEAAGSHRIRLETTAWNEMDFKIPDIAGRMPERRALRRDGVPIHRSTLPLEEIHARLAEAKHEAEMSRDPGRYLCNQVFYRAMEYLVARGIACRAGFVHLPLAADYPTARAADALGHLLRELDRLPTC